MNLFDPVRIGTLEAKTIFSAPPPMKAPPQRMGGLPTKSSPCTKI